MFVIQLYDMNFISESSFRIKKEDCEYIISLFESNKDKQIEGRIGKQIIDKETKNSTDISVHLDEIINYPEWIKCTEILFSGLSQHLDTYKLEHQSLNYLSRWGIEHSYNIQRYFPNQGFYKFHCENTGTKNCERVLAWMIYLNTIDDGGGTEFLDQNLTIKAEEGKIVIWPAGWTHMHRGVISKTETKYIATGWYVLGEKNERC